MNIFPETFDSVEILVESYDRPIVIKPDLVRSENYDSLKHKVLVCDNCSCLTKNIAIIAGYIDLDNHPGLYSNISEILCKSKAAVTLKGPDGFIQSYVDKQLIICDSMLPPDTSSDLLPIAISFLE